MLLPSPGFVRWLYLDLNSYFASVEQQLCPALRGKPVAVIPVNAETTCCIAASYEAKRCGIVTGTDVRVARRLCPEIVFVPARQEHYASFHHRIVAAVNRIVPVDRVLSIDELGVRLMGAERRPERALELARRIKEALRQEVGECLRSSIGLAPNPLLAKIASNMQKPDGLTLLDAGHLPARLEALTLRDIPGIGPRMELRLRQQGITTVKTLLTLTARQMHSIWGSVIGGRYWYWLRSYDFDEPASLQCSIGHQHVLPPRLRTPELACAVARKLLIRAAARLRSRHLWARGLSVYLSFTPGREKQLWECHTRIFESQDTFTLLEIFDRMWSDIPRGPLRHSQPNFAGVELYDLIPEAQHTQAMLPEEAPRRRLAQTMDALQARFGERALYLAGMEPVWDAAPAQIAFSSIPDQLSSIRVDPNDRQL
jgi:DNA polymerase IV